MGGLTGLPDGQTGQTLGQSKFWVVLLDFLYYFMFMTSKWFLYVCDTVVLCTDVGQVGVNLYLS